MKNTNPTPTATTAATTAARTAARAAGIVSPERRAFLARAARAHCAQVLSAAEATANRADAAVLVAREAYAAASTADALAYLAAYSVYTPPSGE